LHLSFAKQEEIREGRQGYAEFSSDLRVARVIR
jgi:hypothetical protein